MKFLSIFVLFTLIVVVNGSWLSAAIYPIILGFGAVLMKINLDPFDVETLNQKNQLTLDKKEEHTPSVTEEKDQRKDGIV